MAAMNPYISQSGFADDAYASAYECVLSRSCSIDNSSYDSAVISFATGFDEFGETVMEEYAIEGDA